jgi:hypothetical protein
MYDMYDMYASIRFLRHICNWFAPLLFGLSNSSVWKIGFQGLDLLCALQGYDESSFVWLTVFYNESHNTKG